MARPKSNAHQKGHRVAAVLAALLLLGALMARLDLRPTLSHVHLRVLSGPAEGNYHAMVDRLRAATAARSGELENMQSEGSMDNLARLAAASKNCEVQAALVQAGLPAPAGAKLTLYGHLAKAESMFFLGRKADEITDFAQLANLRIGVGPAGSGTARVVEQLFTARDLAGLGVVLSHHPNAEQLEMAARGELDLAVFVMDEDAAFVSTAVRDRGLQIAGFKHADVISRRFSFLRHGRIGAGQFDAVRMLPPTDRQVLRVNTLVVGNGCAKRSQVLGLMSTLAEVFPDFVRHNKEYPNATGIPLAAASKSFLDNGGPELLDEYLPRVADVMPPSNWVHLVMVVSVLFNLMGVANRFVLWRIDAARVRAEHEIAHCFGPTATLGDIERMGPAGGLLDPVIGAEIDRVIDELVALRARSRKLSLSMLVPMGGEMAYRYQESLIDETLSVLRAFRDRWQKARA
jgi:hypothetical protein